MVELGAAAPGDKTMVDALVPAVEALRKALADEVPLDLAVAAAAEAAEEGAHATVPMQARKGRASYLGERSTGTRTRRRLRGARDAGARAGGSAGALTNARA